MSQVEIGCNRPDYVRPVCIPIRRRYHPLTASFFAVSAVCVGTLILN